MDSVLAIAGLRYKLLLRRAKGGTRWINLLGAAVLGFFGLLFSVGLTIAFGVLIVVTTRVADPLALRTLYLVAFYSFVFFGLVMPIARGAMDQGLSLTPLAIFPMSRAKLYGVNLAAGFIGPDQLLYYPALITVGVVTMVRLGNVYVLGTALLLASLMFYVIWNNTLVLMLAGLMKRRKVREIGIIVIFVVLILVSIVPGLLEAAPGRISLPDNVASSGAVRSLLMVGRMLPPTMAADGFTALHFGEPLEPAVYLFGLVLWNLVGVLLGYYVFSTHEMGEKGNGARRRRSRRGDGNHEATPWFTVDAPFLAFLPLTLRAVLSKELRYLTRSVAGKFVLLMAPFFVILVTVGLGEMLDQPVFGVSPRNVMFYGLLLYSTLFSSNFVNNAFAWDRDGVEAYFFHPVPLRTILVGKNLAVGVYNLLLFLLTLAAWALLVGFPPPLTLLSGMLIFASALLTSIIGGNIVSVLFPVARDMSSMKSTPSQVAIVLSILTLVLSSLAIFSLVLLPIALELPILEPLLLGLLFAALCLIYVGCLGYADRLLQHRKERFIEAIKNSQV